METTMKMNIEALAASFARAVRISVIGGSMLALAACSTPGEVAYTRLPAIPAQFKEAAVDPSRAAAAPQSSGAWWLAFDDPVLGDLISRANDGNTSIETAEARLARARAVARQTDADRSPQAGIGANVSRQAGYINGSGGPARSFGAVGGNVSYELDLFGRLARASEAAKLDVRSREALVHSARLLVQAEVAQHYLAIRALDDERGILQDVLTAHRGTLDLTERRFRAGDAAELDVARADTEVAATEAEVMAIERRRADVEHALAVLIGEPSSTFAVPRSSWKTNLPVIPPGVPSAVLQRRPDITAAQHAMMAAEQRVGVARTAWFPDVALTGAAGYASPELGDIFKWSARAWGIGALLALPVFDGGRREARVQDASAQLDEARARYREEVLVAFRDVDDQLAALHWLSEQARAQGRAISSSSRATALSDARYRNGFVSQLDLLDARRSELRNRRQALQVRAAQFQSTVGLIKALGGGWEAAL